MTNATVFNAYDVVQTVGPTSDWVDDGSGYVAVSGVNEIYTWVFTVKPGIALSDLATVRLSTSSGDWFKVGVNGDTVQFYNGHGSHDWAVSELTSIHYESNGYGDPLGTFSLLDSGGYAIEIGGALPPDLWTSYRNSTEIQL